MKQTLKTMALLLCAVTMLMTSSCTKENGNQGNNDYQSRILGKWKSTDNSLREYDFWFKTESLVIIADPHWIPKFGDEDDYIMLSYAIEDNELMIGIIGGCIIYNILELTNSKLVLQWKGGNEKFEFTKVN